MKREGEGLLIRIFVGESDRWDGLSLYEAIVQKAREKGLAGATVLRGVEGYGAHNLIHTARVQRLSQDLPMVIEIVDQKEKIEAFLPELDGMIPEGLITLEPVHIILYRVREPGDDERAQ
jgi:PII-like signaling protein